MCLKHTSFGIEGESMARFCVDHKQPDMVDIRHERCQFPSCRKQPSYTLEGESKPRFCVDHKQLDMINVKNERCQFPSCRKQPSYALEGESRARFCVDHKQSDMVDVVNKMCQFPSCLKRPSYALEGESRAHFCVDHKHPDMVNVVSKMCQFEGCLTRGSFGPLYGEALHCATHRQANEFGQRKPNCLGDACRERPTLTTNFDNYPNYCALHAPSEARVVQSAICQQCHGEAIISAQSGLCGVCQFGQQHGTYHKYKEERFCEFSLKKV